MVIIIITSSMNLLPIRNAHIYSSLYFRIYLNEYHKMDHPVNYLMTISYFIAKMLRIQHYLTQLPIYYRYSIIFLYSTYISNLFKTCHVT